MSAHDAADARVPQALATATERRCPTGVRPRHLYQVQSEPAARYPRAREEICAQPRSNPVNCWLDFRACRKAEIPRRAYERSFLGQHDPNGEPQVALVTTDAQGRDFYCLQRNGHWIHDGEHDFPVGG